MRRSLALLATILTAAAVAATAGAVRPQPTKADRTFVGKAGASGMFEVDSAKVALKRSKTAAVRSFAKRMITDHTRANKQLMAIAKLDQITTTTKPTTTEQTQLRALKAASSAAFDAMYAKQQVQAHKLTIAIFTHPGALSPAMLKFDKKSLPMLRMHLKLALALPRS